MKWVITILMLCSSAWAEPFDFTLLVTRQDPSMDWWYAVPQGFEPQLSQVDDLHKQEYFRIIPIFENYKTDLGGAASIVFDVKLTRPDGKVDLHLEKLEGHIGLADVPEPLPAQAVVNTCVEQDHPFGEFELEVVAIDNVGNQTNRQSRIITVVDFEVEKLHKEEREKLFTSYATSPCPSQALASFLQTEQPFFNDEYEPIWSAIWFFKTVFENNEFLIPHLVNEYGFGTPKQKQDIIFLLTLLDETEKLPRLSTEMTRFKRLMEAGRIPDPYDEITMPKQLDLLWAEFFATGTVKPIKQIVSSLELVESAGTLDQIKAGKLDPQELNVYREGMLEAVFQSALWSLKNNCKNVPLVKQYCIGLLLSGELENSAASTLAMLLQSLEDEKTAVKKEKEASNETDYHNE